MLWTLDHKRLVNSLPNWPPRLWWEHGTPLPRIYICWEFSHTQASERRKGFPTPRVRVAGGRAAAIKLESPLASSPTRQQHPFVRAMVKRKRRQFVGTQTHKYVKWVVFPGIWERERARRKEMHLCASLFPLLAIVIVIFLFLCVQRVCVSESDDWALDVLFPSARSLKCAFLLLLRRVLSERAHSLHRFYKKLPAARWAGCMVKAKGSKQWGALSYGNN